MDGSGNETNRQTGQAQYFTEDLGGGVPLEMVWIPAGRFYMGSPDSEEGRYDSEGPQREVTVPGFFMGRYAVTQAQYEQIMGTNPANFKGAEQSDRLWLPVEQVSWDDAQEFCRRLSSQKGKQYRLPSEAEWEYACRAGTSTPFHFGETLTPDLANYNWTSSYASGPTRSSYPTETMVVNSFYPNAFGLYQMHGNVWEWCEDIWHDNYEGAPRDGSAWVTGGDAESRLLRGGSWGLYPRRCRSAFRGRNLPDLQYGFYGFRLACSAART